MLERLCWTWILSLSVMTRIDAETLKPVPIEHSHSKEALRQTLFASTIKQRQCLLLSRDPQGKLTQEIQIQTFVNNLMAALRSSDDKSLRRLFAPRLKVKEGQVLTSLSTLKSIVGGSPQVTNFRVFALNSPDGATTGIECPETGFHLNTLYGYPLTVAVILQVVGEQDVARVFALAVPVKENWSIGAWHIQEWSHAGRDFAMWYETGLSETRKSNPISAYAAFDLAEKLVQGGGFVLYGVQEDIKKSKKQIGDLTAFEAALRTEFKSEKIEYVSPLFARNGGGLLLRIRLEKERSTQDLKKHCEGMVNFAATRNWFSTSASLTGIRCSYLMPNEDSKHEGALGSMWIEAKGSSRALP
jgi:hypothetical protein